MITMDLEFTATHAAAYSEWRWALSDDHGRIRQSGWLNSREQALHDGAKAAVEAGREHGGWRLGVDRHVEDQD